MAKQNLVLLKIQVRFNLTIAKFTRKIGWKRRVRGAHLLKKTSLTCMKLNSGDRVVKKRGRDGCAAVTLDTTPKNFKIKLNPERSITQDEMVEAVEQPY